MAVAKSYQSFQIKGEPFVENGKEYVIVLKPVTKSSDEYIEKKVRWYSDTEYAKMYPGVKIDKTADPFYKSQKEVLGFTDGYITIFKGKTYPHKDYLKSAGAVYRKWWGWGLASDIAIPEGLPSDLTPIKLPWDMVGLENGSLKPDDQVKTAIESLIYDSGDSEFYGTPGQRIEVKITVTKNVPLEGYYGTSYCHTMEDADGHVFVWITGSRSWGVGEEKVIRGTIKEHKTYRNVKQTILTRCTERG